MKKEQIQEKFENWVGRPSYVFYNYSSLVEVFSEEEKDMTEEELDKAINEAAPNLKTPDIIAVVAAFLPVACLDIIDRNYSKGFALFYKAMTWLAWVFMIQIGIDCINGSGNLRTNLFALGCWALSYSFIFRVNSKRWNTLEIIYRVLKVRGKLPVD